MPLTPSPRRLPIDTDTDSRGSPWNSVQLQRRTSSTCPRTQKCQLLSDVRGVGPADSTGNPSPTSYCPGGNRPGGASRRRRANRRDTNDMPTPLPLVATRHPASMAVQRYIHQTRGVSCLSPPAPAGRSCEHVYSGPARAATYRCIATGWRQQARGGAPAGRWSRSACISQGAYPGGRWRLGSARFSSAARNREPARRRPARRRPAPDHNHRLVAGRRGSSSSPTSPTHRGGQHRIKQIKRTGRGYRNAAQYRARILLTSAPKARA